MPLIPGVNIRNTSNKQPVEAKPPVDVLEDAGRDIIARRWAVLIAGAMLIYAVFLIFSPELLSMTETPICADLTAHGSQRCPT